MAKKSKTVDLKPKAEKVSDEQLKRLQTAISDINNIQIQVGIMESRKHNMLHGMAENQKTLLDLQEEFTKDYGTYDINIKNGIINYTDEQTDKKD